MERQDVNNLVDHLFRREAGKLTAVLTRIFGPHHLELAEDVVQDSLLEAMSIWNYKGVPENPVAWLYKVARNKALNLVNREKYKRQYTSEVVHFLKSEWTAGPALDSLFSEPDIQDDQLRMMFTCCHPSISGDSQVALILKTLCGFSIGEIAKAFVTSEQTVTKRLKRARQTIREKNIPFEVPAGQELRSRLDTVLQAIYLLFNEGYNASTGNDLIRYELCGEAIRLAEIILSHPGMEEDPGVAACLALMYLNASRFAARQNNNGEILTMAEQDRSQWDPLLIQKGFVHLERAFQKETLTPYHFMASISAFHCSAPDFASTHWEGILQAYDSLIRLDASPLVALNRAVALAKVHGPEQAIAELLRIEGHPALQEHHLFHSTMAEFYLEINALEKAAEHLKNAIAYSPLAAEKELLKKKLYQVEALRSSK